MRKRARRQNNCYQISYGSISALIRVALGRGEQGKQVHGSSEFTLTSGELEAGRCLG